MFSSFYGGKGVLRARHPAKSASVAKFDLCLGKHISYYIISDDRTQTICVNINETNCISRVIPQHLK